MNDELKELKEYITRFDRIVKILDEYKDNELSEDDKDFLYYYQLHLANAIMLSVGDDSAKKVAKIILGQLEA